MSTLGKEASGSHGIPSREHIKALRREWRQAHRARRHAAFAKVSDCPELLSLIFVQCLPKDNFVTPNFKRAPIKFTRVCRYWRDVALSTPALWSGIRLEIRASYPQGQTNQQRDMLNYWLPLSKEHPFSFSLRYRRAGNADLVNYVISTLLTVSSRWHNIDVALPEWGVFAFIPGLKTAPQLESVCIQAPIYFNESIIWSSNRRQISVVMDLSKSSKLRDFELVGMDSLQLTWTGIPPGIRKLSLDVSEFRLEHHGVVVVSLRYLRLCTSGPATRAIFDCAKIFPELRLLSHITSSTALAKAVLRKPISFPHLRKFKFYVSDGSHERNLGMDVFISNLNLPSIISLSYYDPGVGEWPRLAGLLSRIPTSLKSLYTPQRGRLEGEGMLRLLRQAADWRSQNRRII